MVYAHKVTRVTLSGTMWGGNEIWSTGFWFGQEGSDAANWSQAAIDDVRNAWITFFTSAGAKISNGYHFTQAKAVAISTEGNTDEANTYYSSPTSTVTGAQATIHLPAQNSVAVTLLSDRVRGKASKGRMFLPGIGALVENTTGKIPASSISLIADGMKTFFDALAASANIPDELILVAKGTGLFPELTAQNDYVETIRVGDVVDTQRRRRNALTETYTTRVLV